MIEIFVYKATHFCYAENLPLRITQTPQTKISRRASSAKITAKAKNQTALYPIARGMYAKSIADR